MGEATYYLKARFKSTEDLTAKKNDILTFLQQGSDAHEYWQAGRSLDDADRFWFGFNKQFPLVTKYLGKLANSDYNNDLAGKLDFGTVDDTGFRLEQTGNILTYSAYVWHFAEWDLLADFLMNHFGAVGVDWISDEEANLFDCLNA